MDCLSLDCLIFCFYNKYTMARSKIEKCQGRNKVSREITQKWSLNGMVSRLSQNC